MSSIPVLLKLVKVPTLVILVCAAVANVPVISPLAFIVVAVKACAAIVLPDWAVKVFAVNWKSSAPAIFMSICL